MKGLQILTGALIVCQSMLSSCKEKDEYVYPNVVTEFIDARTDGDGTLRHLITDKGKILDIQPRNGLDGLVSDTVYRTVSVYEPKENDEAYLYSAQLILSMIPVTEDYFKGDLRTDPTDVRSIWQSGNYLNMILTPMVKDQSHAFHFIEQGITERNGRKILALELYHDRNEDEEAFTKEVYLSVPLWNYHDRLHAGDSVHFQINTYKGMTTYKFLYPEIKSY